MDQYEREIATLAGDVRDISVAEIEQRISDLFQLQQDYRDADRKAKDLWNLIKDEQERLATILESHGKSKYVSEHGTVSYKYVSTYKVPKDDDSRAAFFAHLREKGIYDSMITVNSRTLNSWAKAEEAAHPEDIDFQIPGIDKGDPELVVSMTKVK
jgi:hypothetical protein